MGCHPSDDIPVDQWLKGSRSLARKVLELLRGPEGKKIFLTQRRKGAEKTLERGSALRLCAFA